MATYNLPLRQYCERNVISSKTELVSYYAVDIGLSILIIINNIIIFLLLLFIDEDCNDT